MKTHRGLASLLALLVVPATAWFAAAADAEFDRQAYEQAMKQARWLRNRRTPTTMTLKKSPEESEFAVNDLGWIVNKVKSG